MVGAFRIVSMAVIRCFLECGVTGVYKCHDSMKFPS